MLIIDRLLRSTPSRQQVRRCKVLAQLTAWMIEIELALGDIAPLVLLSRWHWAYVVIRIQATLSKAEKHQRWCDTCRKSADRLLLQALDMPRLFIDLEILDMNWLETSWIEEHPFSIQALGHDLCWLLVPIMPVDVSLPKQFKNLPSTLSEDKLAKIRVQIVHQVDRRRLNLQNLAVRIGKTGIGWDPHHNTRSKTFDDFPRPRHIWQLSLSIALHAALETEAYRLGSAFFETQDVAILALSMSHDKLPAAGKEWQGLFEAFPSQEHYAAVAIFRKLEMASRKFDFERLLGWDESVIKSSDQTLARMSLYTLVNAAGPSEATEGP
jgi:hypothetical protein